MKLKTSRILLIIIISIIAFIALSLIVLWIVNSTRRQNYVPDYLVPDPKPDCNLNKFVDDLDCIVLERYHEWINVDPDPQFGDQVPVFRYVPGLEDSDVKMNGIMDNLTCKKLDILKSYRVRYPNKIITPNNYLGIIIDGNA